MNENTTKSKILETMYDLVAQKGYDKASMGQIAQSIGIKKASIYYYFKSKEDIFLQLVENLYRNDYAERSESLSQENNGDSFRQELISKGEAFIDSYYENKNLRKVYAEIDIQTSRIPELKELVEAADAKFNQFLIKRMERGVEVGAFPQDFDTKLNAEILYTLLVGIDQVILYDLPVDPKAVWNEMILKLFGGKVS
ncbi:MAG: TetR/AcrR family transcriptional regulator [Clostridiales bacterium]